jgi:lysophospholipase L1-like esterase
MTILAIGDSIMWGQGNRDPDKFVNLVAASRGAPVTSLAHSGAVIARTSRDGAPAYWGEVPESAPSVPAQLDAARGVVAADDVDLVLLDGGINDMSVFSIVVAVPGDPTAAGRLRRKVTDVFGQAFPDLLRRTLEAFPRATVVVTPYYPIVSEQTDPRQLVALMKHLPAPFGFRIWLDDTVEHLATDVMEATIDVERRSMVEQSELFDSMSRRLMRAAIDALPAPRRAVLAELPWTPDRAFAAPNTWLWTGADDPLAPERLQRYAQHVVQNPLDWPVYTPIASLGHPNRLGAAAYAQAIRAVLP